MERSLAGIFFLVAGVALALAAGSWWMQRIVFTPDATRDPTEAILQDPDIRIELNTPVAAATAGPLGRGVAEIGPFVEEQILSTRAGAAMMGPIVEEIHDRVIGNRDERPVRLTGEQMAQIVRDERAVDAPTIDLPIARIGTLATIRVALGWLMIIGAAVSAVALLLGVVVRPERRDVVRGLGEFSLALGVSMLLFGYLIPVHFVTAIDNKTWAHIAPRLALRTLPVVLATAGIFVVIGGLLWLSSVSTGRRRQSSTPLSSVRYRSTDHSWS